MGLFRQEYWSGLPFPSPGDLPDSKIKSRSPALQVDSLPTEPPEKLLVSPYLQVAIHYEGSQYYVRPILTKICMVFSCQLNSIYLMSLEFSGPSGKKPKREKVKFCLPCHFMHVFLAYDVYTLWSLGILEGKCSYLWVQTPEKTMSVRLELWTDLHIHPHSYPQYVISRRSLYHNHWWIRPMGIWSQEAHLMETFHQWVKNKMPWLWTAASELLWLVHLEGKGDLPRDSKSWQQQSFLISVRTIAL